MHFRHAIRSVAAVTLLPLLLAIPHANAATTFYGFDPGGGGIAHPSSDTAHAAFLAALSGMSVGTETFATVPLGSFLDASISLSFPSTTVTATLTDGPSPLGQVTEVRDGALPPDYFPISGARFIRVEAGANPPAGLSDFFDITFSSPQTAIGFYGTSFSDYFGSTPGTIPRIQISLDGGAGIDTLAPAVDPALVPVGSVNFFGIIADAPFTTARLFNPPGTGNDGIGIDDITIASPAAIPEPSTWALMLAGLAGVVAFTRRKRRIA